MKVLSLIQPWASLVVIGAKLIEVRKWKTTYRGELLIHASKGFPGEYQYLCWHEPFQSALAVADLYVGILPLGAIIGKVILEDCKLIVDKPEELLKKSEMNAPPYPELGFDDYTSGKFGWIFSHAELFKKPIPAKGALRLWEYE
ncbi:MAG TPA: ASCH domain-containing protein [Patescibacteria group bacterium]|nr:ASCH domain-containing protein [Patescibacteria group bacterium]